MKTARIFVALVLQMALAGCGNAGEGEVTLARPGAEIRSEPFLIGVGVHFGIGGEYNYVADRTIRAMDELGVDSYRDDLAWSLFDPDGDGKGNAQPGKLFDLMRKARQTPLLILGHPHPGVPGGNPPVTAQGRAHFAAFVTEAVRATAPFRPIYEIWNEWNMNAKPATAWLHGAGTPDDPRAAANYAALAKSAVPAARAAAPDATILAGSVGVDVGWPWARAIVADGATKDATLSVHLYNHCEAGEDKRTATELIDRLGALQAALGAEGKPVPVHVTEFGWPTASAQCIIDRQTAADNIAQFLLWSAATPWVKGAWIYQLKDQGRDPAAPEDNFGLYDYDYAPKPAACAAREAIRLIRAASGLSIGRPLPDVFILRAQTAAGARLIAWTTAKTPKASLTLKGLAAGAARTLCNGAQPAEDGGRYVIGAEPLVIDIPDVDAIMVQVTAP